MVLLAQKKYQGALQSFEKCYFANKEDTDILLNLSFLFLKVQDHAQCIKFSEEAIILDPHLAGVYQNLSACYLEMHNFDKALDYAEKVEQIRGGINSEEFLKYDDFINYYADILLAKKDIERFIKLSQCVLDSQVFSPELFIKLLRQDINKIKKEYVKVIQDIIDQPDQFINNVEKMQNSHQQIFVLLNTTKKKNRYLKNFISKPMSILLQCKELHFMLANKCIWI